MSMGTDNDMGISIERTRYSDIFAAVAIRTIDATRVIFEVRNDESAGVRYADNLYVLAVLETETPREVFEMSPVLAVENALRECARTDYYYENERHAEYEFAEEDDCNDDD